MGHETAALLTSGAASLAADTAATIAGAGFSQVSNVIDFLGVGTTALADDAERRRQQTQASQ